MKIQSIHIRNFRKLKNCHIDFGEKKLCSLALIIVENFCHKCHCMVSEKQRKVHAEGIYSYKLGID